MLGCCYRTPKTVRPRSAHWIVAPLCLAVFCLTAIVVYRWGEELRNRGSAGAKHTATAYVVERTAKGGQSETRFPLPPPTTIRDVPRQQPTPGPIPT